MTPFGKPVVPLEKGMVARSSKTLKEGGMNGFERPDSRSECHWDLSLLDESMTTALELKPALLSFERIGTKSGVQTHISAQLMVVVCSSSPRSQIKIVINTDCLKINSPLVSYFDCIKD